MKIILFFFLILTLNSVAHSETLLSYNYQSTSYVGFPNTLNGNDFFILRKALSKKDKNRSQDFSSISCREQIKKVICLVDPMLEEEEFENRICQEGGLSYAAYFESLYDNYPPPLQKMFCSLKHIFIEKEFFGTAYASPIYDQNDKLDGALFGIRKSVLDESLSLSTWSSWKEQLSFGGITDSYTISPGLPHVKTLSNAKTNDFLYFVITHEFGHLFDFANELTKINCPEPIPGEAEVTDCDMAEGTFGAISWATGSKPRSPNNFNNREGLCFYRCEGKTLSESDVPDLYESLFNTSFISTYAATNAWDDFAESLAYFMIDQNLSSTYLLDTKQGQNYNSISKLNGPVFNKKLEYLKNFLKRSDIIYP